MVKAGQTIDSVINLKNAVDFYFNNKNIPLYKISKKFNISLQCLTRRLNQLNINTSNPRHICKFNNHIFDIIDTEEKAYWLGFIYADGCISDKNNFEISLKESDKLHLEKLNKFLNGKNKITICKTNYKDKNRCRLSYQNKRFGETLKSYGCVPRKSLILEFPKEEIFIGNKQELIRHFIRGYFDGDGCISFRDKKHR